MTGARTVLMVIATAALAATGCVRTVDGVSSRTPVAPEAARAAHRAVPIAALDGLLLTQQQIVALVGGANMALVVTANSMSDASLLIDDHSCLSLGSVGDVATYANSGYVGMRGNQFSTPNAVAADVTQLVVSFPAAPDAQGLLQRARQDWRGCANRRYGFHSSNGNHSFFDTGELRGGDSRIELSMRQEEDPRWGCSHAMSVGSNVVAEARVCLFGNDVSAAGAAVSGLLDQIVAKIPQ
jgi:hypothetical protein